MWLGFYDNYPETYFTDEDIAILKSSPFIKLGNRPKPTLSEYATAALWLLKMAATWAKMCRPR